MHEVADHLHVSYRKVKGMVASGLLKGFPVGCVLRFDLRAVDRQVMKGSTATRRAAEVRATADGRADSPDRPSQPEKGAPVPLRANPAKETRAERDNDGNAFSSRAGEAAGVNATHIGEE